MGERKQTLLRYAGNMAQLCGVDQRECTEGRARGMRVWQVRTGGGLEFDLLPDMCLDIGALRYRGINISWLAKNGYASGVYGYPVLNEFDRYFGGGMLWTCGLKNTGGDYVDADGKFQHLHGRLGITPCEKAWTKEDWDGDEYVIIAGGTARDSILAGHDLTLTRELRTVYGGSEIEITDTIENLEPEETDYLSLYHFNFGYPFVSPELALKLPEAERPVLPRTEAAARGMAERMTLELPVDGYEEQCFFHHFKADADGWCRMRMENAALGIAAELAYERALLPVVTQWKSVRSGEYVLGMEPGNSYLRGMETERAEGHVGRIGGFETRTIRMKLKFMTL